MIARVVLPLAVAAACVSASAVPVAAGSQIATRERRDWVSFPITARVHPESTIARRDRDVPLYNISSLSYLIELSIGSPGQSVKVAIDTGSDELWVNPNCQNGKFASSQKAECLADGKFTPSSSSSARNLTTRNGILYGRGSVNFTYFSDSISLPQSTISITKTQFGVAYNTLDLNEGILGLGWGLNVNLAYSNFIDNLADQGVTNSKAFSVALGNADASNSGVLIFGGVDTKKFSGPLVTNKILGRQGNEKLNRYWIQMTGVAFSPSGKSSEAIEDSGLPVVLDSGSSLSYLPSSIVQDMASNFRGTSMDEDGYINIPCSARTLSGTFDFSFGAATIKVPFSDFIWQSTQGCVLGVVAILPGTRITALLGDTFMRSAFVVFDQTQKTISMAQYANCGENEQSIPNGGSANFTGECGAGDVSGATSGASGTSNSGKNNGAGRIAFSTSGLVVALLACFMMSFM